MFALTLFERYAIYEKDRERAAGKLHTIDQQREAAAAAVDESDRLGGTSDEARAAEKARAVFPSHLVFVC